MSEVLINFIIFTSIGILNCVQLVIVYFFLKFDQVKRRINIFLMQFTFHLILYFLLLIFSSIFLQLNSYFLILHIFALIFLQIEFGFVFFKVLTGLKERASFFILAIGYFTTIRFFYEVRLVSQNVPSIFCFLQPEGNIYWLGFFFHVQMFFFSVFFFAILLTAVVIFTFYPKEPKGCYKEKY